MSDEHAPSPSGTVIHNPVLMRERQPHERDHRWVMIVAAAAVIVVAAGSWAYLKVHPPTPFVNHAVATAPATTGWPR